MLYEEMGVRPSSVDSQHPASCRMCPYIGIAAGFLYTPLVQFFFHLQVGPFWVEASAEGAKHETLGGGEAA